MSDQIHEELQIKFREASEDGPAMVAVFREDYEYPVFQLGVLGILTPERRTKIAGMIAELLREILEEPDAPIVSKMAGTGGKYHEH